MKYYISPPEKTSWSMSPSEFVGHLLQRWPNVKVRTTSDPELSPEWRVQLSDTIMDGRFYPPLSGVVFEGIGGDDLVSFALWFRSLVPPEQPLLFYLEGFNWDMELKPNTTAQEIVAALNDA